MFLDRQIAIIIAMFTRGRARVVTGADRWPVWHCPKTGLVITMVITPHYPRLIDGGWENVYLAQVCPRVPPPSSGLQSTLLTVGNFTLGPQPAPAASRQPPAATRHQHSLLLSGTSN